MIFRPRKKSVKRANLFNRLLWSTRLSNTKLPLPHLERTEDLEAPTVHRVGHLTRPAFESNIPTVVSTAPAVSKVHLRRTNNLLHLHQVQPLLSRHSISVTVILIVLPILTQMLRPCVRNNNRQVSFFQNPFLPFLIHPFLSFFACCFFFVHVAFLQSAQLLPTVHAEMLPLGGVTSKDDSVLSRPIHRQTTKTRSASQVVNNRFSCGEWLLAPNASQGPPYYNGNEPCFVCLANSIMSCFEVAKLLSHSILISRFEILHYSISLIVEHQLLPRKPRKLGIVNRNIE